MRAITALLFLLTCHTVVAAPTPEDRAVESARQGIARQKEYKTDFKVPAYDRGKVKALADRANERGAAELERLRSGERSSGGLLARRDMETQTRPTVRGRVVVALSSSMPEAMLTSYLQQLDGKPESLVVLRGFVGGAKTVQKTGLWMEKVRRKQSGAANGLHVDVETVVDPLFFRQLGIDRVPAVAWLDGVQTLAHCDQEDYSRATVVYGAVSVESALKEARKAGATVPDVVIAKYRGTGWERRP